MVKSKRGVHTPRKRSSLTKHRTIAKVVSRANSATSSASTPTGNIKVLVRVRPLNLREQDENYRLVVKIVDEQLLIFDPKDESQGFFFHGVQQKGRDLLKKERKDLQFMFDKVFPGNSTTQEVFEDSTYSLIDSLMNGYNCSVFAYGATGAGKTFTMTGNIECPGITFLTMTELFRKREELSIERDFELGITYLEVYNEMVKDLLNPGAPLNLREDTKYGVTVAGIKVYKIKNPDELFSLLEQGNKNRTQHPTDANAESSRSHAVFQVYIQMSIKGTKEIRTAKLSMIDLAGSERGSATGYVGARFTEGANINKSLLALGNCINSLADGLRHVPYRDSKLTRLLKDSLGGNCQTVMIANVSPSSRSFEDTYNTLKYAYRAKKIKSNIKRNVENIEMHVGQYVKMLRELKDENTMLKKQLEENKSNKEDNEWKEKYDKLKVEFQNMCDYGGGSVVVNDEILDKLNALILEKREYLARQSQLQKTECATAIRRLLKEEINDRLSDICTSSPEKRVAHKKINMTLDRFKKQEIALKCDLESIEGLKSNIDDQLDDIMKEYPQLRNYIKLENFKLKQFQLKNRLELEVKSNELLLGNHEEKTELLEKTASTLKSFYMLLKGHGFASASVTQQYQDIVSVLQGQKNVTWSEMPDSGISSTTSISSEEEVNTVGSKRKIEEHTADELNATFKVPVIITPHKPKVQVCAEQIMTKALKPLCAKRLVNGRSPKNKENNPFHKPFDIARSVAKARLVVAAKTDSGLKGSSNSSTKPKTLTHRPPFRR